MARNGIVRGFRPEQSTAATGGQHVPADWAEHVFVMTFVERRPGEGIDQMMKRWKTLMDKAGVVREFKRRQRFMPETERRRLKARAAARRRSSASRRGAQRQWGPD